MRLESLDGLGACVPTKKRFLVNSQQLLADGNISVGEILLKEGIESTRLINTQTNQTVYQVQTENGMVTLPSVVPLAEQSNIVAKAKGKLQAIEAVVTETVNDLPFTKDQLVTGGKWALALLLTGLTLNAIKPNRTGLSGVQPAVVRKRKLETLHI